MEGIIAFCMAALSPLQALAMMLWGYAPVVLAGLVLLLVGSLLGRFVRDMLERVLNVVRLDDHAKRIGAHDILHRLGLGSSMTRLMGIIAYGVILLAFVLAAADVVGLAIVSEFLGRVVGFMPKLIAVVLVLGGGLFLGNLAGQIVYRSASANRIKGAEALSKVTYGLMVIFSGVLALQHLGIDTSIISNSIQIIIAAVGLGVAIAFGIAFGMAGRDTAEKLIRDLTPKHTASKDRKVKLRRAA